ncbi:MAG: class II fructose-bisphosphate aldolase [bacterium]
MLVNLKEILDPARADGYAVGHFNVLSMVMCRGVLEAAEELGKPVIIGIEEKHLPICPLEDFSFFAIPMARRAKVPVAVHFDHAHTFDKCIEALKYGFTSVNYDCSECSFDENAWRVAEMVHTAHAFGASVEAQLGFVPEAADVKGGKIDPASFTEPEEAKLFAERTGVDALGIAAGTAHGEYLFRPKVDYPRIREISEATGLPLVLHGGSGLSDRALRKAIQNGVSKINIFTDINIAGGQGATMALGAGKNLFTDIIPYEVHAIRVQAAEKIRLLYG